MIRRVSHLLLYVCSQKRETRVCVCVCVCDHARPGGMTVPSGLDSDIFRTVDLIQNILDMNCSEGMKP